jgi:hypothetical protein
MAAPKASSFRGGLHCRPNPESKAHVMEKDAGLWVPAANSAGGPGMTTKTLSCIVTDFCF